MLHVHAAAKAVDPCPKACIPTACTFLRHGDVGRKSKYVSCENGKSPSIYNDSKARLFLGVDHDITGNTFVKFEQIIGALVDMKIG